MDAPTPRRPDDEVVGAFVPITLAGKEYRLAELPRQANREYQRLLQEQIKERLEVVGPLDTADQVIEAIAEAADVMLDLLIAYDVAGAKAWSEVHGTEHSAVLPERDWLDSRATDRECYVAMKYLTKEVVFPFGGDLLKLAPEVMPLILNSVSKGVAAAAIAMTSSLSTSSAPPSTDGSPTTSSDG